MIGFNEDCTRFRLSSNCYIDLNSQKIVDTDGTKITRRLNINSNYWVIVKLLLENLQTGVSLHTLCDCCQMDEGNVRNYISRLRKKHPLLGLWIPECHNGIFRLEAPVLEEASSEAPAKKPERPPLSPSGAVLRSTKIITRPNFVTEAREDVFAALDQAFTEQNTVFLHGLGGIGKSETAKNWAIEKKKAGVFDTVVFAQLNKEEGNSNVMSLITDDTTFVISGDFRNHGDMTSAGMEESEEAYFHRKLAKIKQLCDERTLIIIDNYDISDPYLAKLFSGNYRLLITTRNVYDGFDFPFIPVEEIKNPLHLKSIFFKNLGDACDDIDSSDPYIDKLFELVSRHTLAVELIAKALADAPEDTPETLYRKMCSAGTTAGMYAIDGEVESSVSEKTLSPFRCIQILFNLSRLKADSDFACKVQVLTYMALMPTKGIALSLFRKWSSNKTFRAAKSLIKKSWLRDDRIDDVHMLSMHPLIREVVWHDLSPSADTCYEYLLQMAKDAHDAWHRRYHENMPVGILAASVLKSFPELPGEYWYLFSPLVGLLWQLGQFEQSIYYGHALYEACVKAHGESSMAAGFVAMSLGGCYFNSRRLEESVPWYQKGLECMLASGEELNLDVALAHEKVARCCTWEFCRDFDRAQKLFDQALAMYRQMLEEVRSGKERKFINHWVHSADETNILSRIAGVHMEMGRMYQLMGNYEKALWFIREDYRIMQEYWPNNISSISYTYFDQGVCLYHLGIQNPDKEESTRQLQEALAQLRKAMENNLLMRGELAIDIVDNHEMLGDTYLALDMPSEAEKEYRTAVGTLESLFGKGCPHGDGLREKLRKVLR